MSKLSQIISNLLMSLVFFVIATILAACLAYPIKWLWNFGISPAVDGLNEISAIQALLIFLLIKIFFTNIDKELFS